MDDDFLVVSKEIGLIWSNYADETANIEVVQFQGRKAGEVVKYPDSLSARLYEIYELPSGEYAIFHHQIRNADRAEARFLNIDGRESLTLRELQDNLPDLAVAINFPASRSLRD